MMMNLKEMRGKNLSNMLLSCRISSGNESCDEDLAYDELTVSHKKLNDRNTDTCKQLEDRKISPIN